jgi:flagellar protein FlbD
MDTVLQLTRLGGPVFALNPDLIERAEATPDTVVTLVNGSKYVIRESLEELTALIRAYRADVVAAAQSLTESPAPAARPRHNDEPRHIADTAVNNVVALRPNGEC